MGTAPIRRKIYVVGESTSAVTYTCEAAVGTPLGEESWSIVKTDYYGSNAYPTIGGVPVTGRRFAASDYATLTYTALDA